MDHGFPLLVPPTKKFILRELVLTDSRVEYLGKVTFFLVRGLLVATSITLDNHFR